MPLLEEPKVAQKLFRASRAPWTRQHVQCGTIRTSHCLWNKAPCPLAKTSKLLARAFLWSMFSISSFCPIVLVACLTASSITQCSQLVFMLIYSFVSIDVLYKLAYIFLFPIFNVQYFMRTLWSEWCCKLTNWKMGGDGQAMRATRKSPWE